MARTLRATVAGLLAAILLGGCGSSIQQKAEAIFAQCIEDAGGTVGEFEGYVEDGQLLLVAGPVDTDPDTFQFCVDFTNTELANR
jgi:hypothetical protein